MGVTTIGSGGSQTTGWYGVCSSVPTASNKVVTVQSGFELKNGVSIIVLFKYNNTAVSPMLNVNGTGAFNVCYANGSSADSKAWARQEIVELIYSEGTWNIHKSIAAGSRWGSVALMDEPSDSQDVNGGYAATPKSVQTAIDAALPKAGGTMTGNLRIEPDTSETLSAFITATYGDNNEATIVVDDSRAALQMYGGEAGNVTLDAKDGTSALTISSDKSIIQLKGKVSAAGSVSTLNIRNTGNTRRIYGLTEPEINSDATNKDYVDNRFPTGSVILWYGSASNIPTGFIQCNGNNNTPNLTSAAPAGCMYIMRQA